MEFSSRQVCEPAIRVGLCKSDVWQLSQSVCGPVNSKHISSLRRTGPYSVPEAVLSFPFCVLSFRFSRDYSYSLKRSQLANCRASNTQCMHIAAVSFSTCTRAHYTLFAERFFSHVHWQFKAPTILSLTRSSPSSSRPPLPSSTAAAAAHKTYSPVMPESLTVPGLRRPSSVDGHKCMITRIDRFHRQTRRD